MSDPLPLGNVISLLERTWERIGEADQTPQGKRQRAAYLASEQRRRAQALVSLAAERNIPCETGVRRVMLEEHPLPTQALCAVQKALAWRAEQPTAGGSRQPLCMVLGGTPGTGKTSAMSWAVVRSERSAGYVTARQIGSTPENGWSENKALWDRWRSLDLLAIDELGLEDQEDLAGRIGVLLAERYDRGRATLAAGNIDGAAFVSRYSNPRLRSRLSKGQALNGASGGLPWWTDLAECDLRNPANRAALDMENAR